MGNIHRRKRKERLRGRRMAEEAWRAAERSDLGKAEETLRNALKSREGDCVLWNDLALILWKKRELREAEKCFRTALLLRPGYEDGKMNLAALLASRGFFRQALRLEEELSLSSPRAEFHRKKAEEYRILAEKLHVERDVEDEEPSEEEPSEEGRSRADGR